MGNSTRKMLENKEAKRADVVQVRYESIHVAPGFDLRQHEGALEESIEALAVHTVAGGRILPLVVRSRDEGGVWIVDGHRRHAALGRALTRGAAWVHVVYFEGNDASGVTNPMSQCAAKSVAPMSF